MKAPLPYHFCVIIGCCEMTPPGAIFCLRHCATEYGLEMDLHFPHLECFTADASQRSNPPTPPVPGDAGTNCVEQ